MRLNNSSKAYILSQTSRRRQAWRQPLREDCRIFLEEETQRHPLMERVKTGKSEDDRSHYRTI